jgi:hypothetical protein
MKKAKKLFVLIFVILNVVASSAIAADDDYITRQQMAIEVKKLYLDVVGGYMSVTFSGYPYDDVDSLGAGASAIEICYGLNIMKGIGDRKFDPDGKLTRAQAATIAYRLFDRLKESERHSRELFEDFDEESITEAEKFIDNNEIPLWAKYSVYALKEEGIVIGDENDRFNPDEYLIEKDSKSILDRIRDKYN